LNKHSYAFYARGKTNEPTTIDRVQRNSERSTGDGRTDGWKYEFCKTRDIFGARPVIDWSGHIRYDVRTKSSRFRVIKLYRIEFRGAEKTSALCRVVGGRAERGTVHRDNNTSRRWRLRRGVSNVTDIGSSCRGAFLQWHSAWIGRVCSSRRSVRAFPKIQRRQENTLRSARNINLRTTRAVRSLASVFPRNRDARTIRNNRTVFFLFVRDDDDDDGTLFAR